MIRLLLVDDDQQINRLVRRYLENAGFQVISALNVKSALEAAEREAADLAIVDIMLPDGSGLDLVQQLHHEYMLPVIMITARGGIEDKSIAFRHGADDYLVKPFDPNELILRVQAVLKRVSEAGSAVKNPLLHRQAMTFGRPETIQLTLDSDNQAVYLDQQPIAVPRREFQLLSLLAENQNQTLTREQIVDHLWGLDFEGDLRVVDLYIDRLRKKLAVPGSNPADWSIRTVRGLGYRLEVHH